MQMITDSTLLMMQHTGAGSRIILQYLSLRKWLFDLFRQDFCLLIDGGVRTNSYLLLPFNLCIRFCSFLNN